MEQSVKTSRVSFLFKCALILAFGGFSLYYMQSYSTEEGPEFDDEKKRLFVTNMNFVHDRYPDAIGKKDGKNFRIESEISGFLAIGNTAPVAWKNARINIEKGIPPVGLK